MQRNSHIHLHQHLEDVKVLERDPRGDYDRVLVDAEFGMPRDHEIR